MTASHQPPFKQLPPRPDIKHLKNQARRLLDELRRGDLEAQERIRASLPSAEASADQVSLQQAQSIVAREYGFRDWSALSAALQDKTNTYDQYADQYAERIAGSGEAPKPMDLPLHYLLGLMGDVEGLAVLDAGCGEGFLARMLADREARVTGVDISPRFVDIARARDTEGEIDFLVRDLSAPWPDCERRFDLAVSNFVLNDVPDYKGYIATLGAVIRPGGRLVAALNNPYSAVRREKVEHYFDSGTSIVYAGIAAETGIKVFYYHRTMEEFVEAFRESGFLLRRLSDVCPTEEALAADPSLDRWYHFPAFMALELVRQ